MFQFIKSLFGRTQSSASARRPKCRAPHKAHLGFEQLEDRLVPAVTDMTQLANLFPTPTQPTMLYLNFDGGTNLPGANGNVSPFSGTSQQV
jgi:hypothetical protein